MLPLISSNMAYIPYVTEDEYSQYGSEQIPDEELEKRLRAASRHIDTLTFNRIVDRGFDSLTDFQQEIIKEVVILQADFEYENADEIETILSSYSINGVSAKFGDSWNILTDRGVAIKKDTYELLKQTGLCCRLLR